MNRKLILILGIPVLGSAVVFGAFALRSGPERLPEQLKRGVAATVAAAADSPIVYAPPRPPAPKPAPEKTIAVAMDEARLKTTYQNYRTALATGNHTQADALYPILRRERKAALRLAEEDLSQAKADFDRAVAGKAVDALRR